MRLVLQRVKQASVHVAGTEVASIGEGLLAFVGFGSEDGLDLPETAAWPALLKKVLELRIFPDAAGKLNESLCSRGGGLLLVSQFTLYADCRRGRRPSFSPAAGPHVARQLFDRFVQDMEALLPGRVASGLFGEDMDVSLINWGPVTIALSSDLLLQPREGD